MKTERSFKYVSKKKYLDTHLYHLIIDKERNRIILEEIFNFISGNKVLRTLKQELYNEDVKRDDRCSSVDYLIRYMNSIYGVKMKIEDGVNEYYIGKEIGKEVLVFLLVVSGCIELAGEYIEVMKEYKRSRSDVAEEIVNVLSKAYVGGTYIGYHLVSTLIRGR